MGPDDNPPPIFKPDGTLVHPVDPGNCDHGVSFDEEEARRILGDWEPRNSAEFVAGNPNAPEVRKRWPRLDGVCPKGCGFVGIAYASEEHYILGDW